MVFKHLCVHVHWTKVASALERLLSVLHLNFVRRVTSGYHATLHADTPQLLV